MGDTTEQRFVFPNVKMMHGVHTKLSKTTIFSYTYITFKHKYKTRYNNDTIQIYSAIQ